MGTVCHKSYDKYNAVNQLFDYARLWFVPGAVPRSGKVGG
jgi:hypothetical protein